MNESDKKLLTSSVSHDTLYNVQYYLTNYQLQHDDESFFDYDLLKTALYRQHQSIINFLLKLGCRVRNPSKTNSEETPLHLAMKLGVVTIIRKILSNGASIYDKDPKGDTALQAAFKEKRYHAVEAVFNYYCSTRVKQLNHRKTLNPSNKDDLIHFHIACVIDNTFAVKQYLSAGFDINIPFSLNSTELCGLNPFQFAAMKSKCDMISQFLRHNADLSIKNGDGQTPLQIIYYSASFGLGSILITEMFRYGNNTKFVDYVDSNGVSHFHLCCIANDPQNVQVFIDKGADVNSATFLSCPIIPGFTPLHIAVMYDCEKVVLLLLEYGADCNIANKEGSTPLHLACKSNQLKKNQIIEMLLYYEACSTAEDKNGLTPLLSAFNCNEDGLKKSTLDMLISKTPRDVNFTDQQGLSHFHVVCTRNDISRVFDFLTSGVPINDCINSGKYSGYTALHLAVLYNQKDVVELLLKWNAQVNIKTSEFQLTPLHLACSYSHMKYVRNEDRLVKVDWRSSRENQVKIIELLLLHQADVDARDSSGQTPLLRIFTISRLDTDYSDEDEITIRTKEIIRILLLNGANVSICTNNGKSILHLITQNYLIRKATLEELAECFIAKGANVDGIDNDGLTPLHIMQYN